MITAKIFLEKKIYKHLSVKDHLPPSFENYVQWMEEYSDLVCDEILGLDRDNQIFEKVNMVNMVKTEEKPKIEFIESHGFCGESFAVKVDDKLHYLNGYMPHSKDNKKKAMELLKHEYGIDYKYTDILFVWDGSL